MVVEGGNLKITGGTFTGAVYVMGNLQVAGNAQIVGTIFVDGAVEDITTISGTPAITYSATEVQGAFGYNPMPFVRGTWRETYN